MTIRIQQIVFYSQQKTGPSMGVQENNNSKHKNNRQPQPDSDSEESNETMPVPALQRLSLDPSIPNSHRNAPHCQSLLHHIKSKPIKKKNRRGEVQTADKLRLKIQKMAKTIKQLEDKLKEARTHEDSCPHCHFYTNQPKTMPRQCMTLEENSMLDAYNRSASKDSIQFEKIDFNLPLMCSPEMEEKSWIFLGTIMIAMGSKVMDMDGTVNVFKVLKESVDHIRRQVEKSEEKLSMDFFLVKEELESEYATMNGLDFDPFYHKQDCRAGLQLEGVRVESVEEYDLCFDQKLRFNVKYDALITIMEYMKENCSVLLS